MKVEVIKEVTNKKNPAGLGEKGQQR